MKKDAEANEAEDKKFKELVETRNKADMLIASTENTLKDHSGKVTEEEKKAIEAAIEKLSKAAQKLAEEVYKEAQAKQQAGAAGQQGSADNAKKDDDIEDAEIVD